MNTLRYMYIVNLISITVHAADNPNLLTAIVTSSSSSSRYKRTLPAYSRSNNGSNRHIPKYQKTSSSPLQTEQISLNMQDLNNVVQAFDLQVFALNKTVSKFLQELEPNSCNVEPTSPADSSSSISLPVALNPLIADSKNKVDIDATDLHIAEDAVDPVWAVFSSPHAEPTSLSLSQSSSPLSPLFNPLPYSFGSSPYSCSTSAEDDNICVTGDESDVPLPTNAPPFLQPIPASPSPVKKLVYISPKKKDLCKKIQHLQQDLITLTHAVTAVQQRQHHILSCNQAPQISFEGLLQAWQRTVPQLVFAPEDHALKVTDNYLNALPLALRFNEHFFVQHILLAKASLYHRKFITLRKQGCQNWPMFILQAQQLYLKQARHFLGSVNPILLNPSSMDKEICSSAQLTYNNLKLQLEQNEQQLQQHLQDLMQKKTCVPAPT